MKPKKSIASLLLALAALVFVPACTEKTKPTETTENFYIEAWEIPRMEITFYKDDPLKGKVKMTDYLNDNEEIYSTFEYFYDDKGESIGSRERGSFAEGWNFEETTTEDIKDDNGNVVSKTERLIRRGKVIREEKIDYNDEGKVVARMQKERLAKGGWFKVVTTKFVYDDKGRKVSETRTKNGEMVFETRIDYSDAGGMSYSETKYGDGRLQKVFYRPDGARLESYRDDGKIGSAGERIVDTEKDITQRIFTGLNYEEGTMRTSVGFNSRNDLCDHAIGISDHVIIYDEVPIKDVTLPFLPVPYGYKYSAIEYEARLSDNGKTVVTGIKNVSTDAIEVNESSFYNPDITISWPSETPDGISRSETISFTDEPRPQPPEKIVTLASGESLQHTTNLLELFTGNPSVKEKFPKVPLRSEVTMRFKYENLFPSPPVAKSTTRLTVKLDCIEEILPRFPELFSSTETLESKMREEKNE